MRISSRIHRIVDSIHLVYLGLLPALATFAVLSAYGHPAMVLLFIWIAALIAGNVLHEMSGQTRSNRSDQYAWNH